MHLNKPGIECGINSATRPGTWGQSAFVLMVYLGIVMLLPLRIQAQNSLELLGNLSNRQNSQFRLNSFESNTSNFSGIRDWEFSVTYGGEFSGGYKGNLYLLSMSKRLGEHYFNVRYTPGYQKDFVFNTGTSISRNDTLAAELKSQLHYEEIFGFGYSHSLLSNLSGGFSFRYFSQEFTSDQASLRYDNSTTSIIVNTVKEPYNFWTGDLGFNLALSNDLSLNLSTINLISSSDAVSEPNKAYSIKTDKSVLLGLNYRVKGNFNTKLYYELNNSFQAILNIGFYIGSGFLSFSAGIFHDKYQSPFIAGIAPGINYSTDIFSVSLSGVKYLSDRQRQYSLREFLDNGIHNVLNNNFSSDKVALTINFALNTVGENLLKFVDVSVVQDIYPTLSDNYIDNPFAFGKVVNLSDKAVSVKAYCMIPGVNDEKIQSPSVTVGPKDTVQVPFYTLINPGNRIIKKPEISQASFYVISGSGSGDDEFHKPVLINDVNSWDGKVSNLRYFVWKDFDYTLSYAKQVIQQHKAELDTLSAGLSNFYITSLLFNDFISQMVYVSDPRASVNRVQFPSETMKLKGGACDDLSVGFSSLLESVGIQTAFVDYKSDTGISHVNLLINTGLTAQQALLITKNDRKYVLRKNLSGQDEVWIPLEMTSLTNFKKAWETGAEKFNSEATDGLGLAKGIVQIVDIF